MDPPHTFARHSVMNLEELNTSQVLSTSDKNVNLEAKQPTRTVTLTNIEPNSQLNLIQPQSYTNSLPGISNNRIINNLNNTTEPELNSTKAKPKRRTCYQCGEAGHTTTNCSQAEVNHNLPKRSSGKKLTPEEIQLVIHCYFKCEEERLDHKIAIKSDSIRRTAFYLGMSKNTVARLVREYAQTGELPVSKARSEIRKSQSIASSSSRKKAKCREVDDQKTSSVVQITNPEAVSDNRLVSESSLPYSRSLSPGSNILSNPVVSTRLLPPVTNLRDASPIMAVSAQSLMGIHEMLTNSSSHFFESDAALSNIMNPVEEDEDEPMFNFQ